MNNISFSVFGICYVFPFLFLLLPLTVLLAWQDWKERLLNVGTILATLIALTLNIHYPFHVLGIFCFLWGYRYFRKNSIQLVDIVLFSFGAGCFAINFLPVYCMITAGVLVVIFKTTQTQKLPFVVAWAIGFWGTYCTGVFIN